MYIRGKIIVNQKEFIVSPLGSICSATYLTLFYVFHVLFKIITPIFDSNLKRNFKYGKHATKYGKSGRELQSA